MVKYLLPSTTLKRNPYDLVKHARNDLMLGKETPVWFKTINQFPMAPAALSRPDPLKNGSFCLEILKRNDGTFNRLSTKYYTEARHIKYPEDKTRQLFYKSHPFELVNPLNLVQDENEMRPYSTPPVPDATLTDFKIDGAVRGERYLLINLVLFYIQSI